ncbi:hypothetical protein FNJ84_06495 [Paracoccus sp. M683]|uniref:hypothetical protein n=1 Tax=Paracoccus sp. M683 TaxID=2594268 RepID=UPI001180B583|nr:hypothetical protein [Paracoccus sp. M683]TRW98419.1 hypothetical protein FNJ84_06495 [Paracoccus sp. M683]
MNARYSFRHDQIRQAVRDRLTDEEQALRHLQIARLMLDRVGEEELPGRAVEIFGHVVIAGSARIAQAEVVRLAHLGLVAAEQAQLGLAFATARQYLGTVQDMMGGGWNDAIRPSACRFARPRQDVPLP